MPQMRSPHDRFFKRMIAQPEAARDFVRYYLPPEVVSLLDLNTLEASKDTFVDAELRQHFSDLLYRVELRDGRGAYVYVLFEHKSYPDALVAFQLLRYLVRIWEQDLQQQRGLRPIVPVVVYHGLASWRVGLDFWSLFDGPEELKPYVPDYVYWLCDLSRYSEEELKGAVILRMTLLTLKHILHDDLGEHLEGILTLGAELSRKETGLEYLETLLRYLAQATDKIGEDELREAVEAALPEGGRVMATIAERWMERGLEQGLERGLQRGLQQGLQQGQQQGIREGLLAGIEVALEIRFGSKGLKLLPEIYKIQDVDLLRAVHRGLTSIETLDDLRSLYAQDQV